jgi:molybdate transport system substrate-binding protein
MSNYFIENCFRTPLHGKKGTLCGFAALREVFRLKRTARTIDKFILVALILLYPLFFLQPNATSADLLLFAGAGIRQPTDQLIEQFKKETGHTIRVTYAGSGQLLSSILASGQGDLFMPGAFFYIEKLQKMGKIKSHHNLVAHTAVVGVNKKKETKIRTFDDLAKPGLRLALGDPKAMAFGRVADKILSRSSLKEEILENVVVYGATVKQLAMYVANGDADASIIGSADAWQFRDRIAMVPIPKDYFQPETIAIAVLKSTTAPEWALLFQDFMAKPSSISVFEHFGFLPLRDKAILKKQP